MTSFEFHPRANVFKLWWFVIKEATHPRRWLWRHLVGSFCWRFLFTSLRRPQKTSSLVFWYRLSAQIDLEITTIEENSTLRPWVSPWTPSTKGPTSYLIIMWRSSGTTRTAKNLKHYSRSCINWTKVLRHLLGRDVAATRPPGWPPRLIRLWYRM